MVSSHARRLLPLLSTSVLLLATRALADERSIIHVPGDHPHYIFEVEPHAIVGFGAPFDAPGGGGAAVGLGFRGTVHIANGFVPSINDSVGVGFGVDFAPGPVGRVLVPIVLQWNFWLSTHWSVFGEPGFALTSGPVNQFDPFIFYGGARYAFTPRILLTMRAGYPDLSVGVSFLL